MARITYLNFLKYIITRSRNIYYSSVISLSLEREQFKHFYPKKSEAYREIMDSQWKNKIGSKIYHQICR